MKRDELVDFTDEQKDLIMSLYGKAIAKKEKEIELLKTNQKELEENNKTLQNEINGLNETIENNNKSLEKMEKLTGENSSLKADIELNKSNVKNEFSEFVKSKVLSKVDDKTDFATALENYKKEAPQYFGDTVVKKVQSSPALNTGVKQPQTTNDIMNDILRSAGHND